MGLTMQSWRRLALLLAMVIGLSPAVPVQAAESGFEHFLGCFSTIFDSATHAAECGPVERPSSFPTLSSPGDNAPSGSTLPPPSCCSCSGPTASLVAPVGEMYQFTSGSGSCLAPGVKQRAAQGCCPCNGS